LPFFRYSLSGDKPLSYVEKEIGGMNLKSRLPLKRPIDERKAPSGQNIVWGIRLGL